LRQQGLGSPVVSLGHMTARAARAHANLCAIDTHGGDIVKKSIQAVEIDSLEVEHLGQVTRGLQVMHPLFGAGTVVALFVFPNGSHTMGIEFETNGYKALVSEYARLRLHTR
jgi:hypothetical protein